MKKRSLFFVFIIVGIIVASCKSHEKCPAYSKTNSADFSKVA